MKSLIDYIKESTYEKISTEWMIEHYNKFNAEYFFNELPNAEEIDIQYTYGKLIKGSLLGVQGFHETGIYFRNKLKNGKYIMHFQSSLEEVTNILDMKPYIYINSNIPMSMTKYEDTLIHEMIHLWTSIDCAYPKQAHGKEFKAKCNKIRKMAKDKYNIDYELTTYASKENENFDVESIIKDQLKGKNVKNIVGLFISFNAEKLKDPKQGEIFLFCTRNVSNKLINYVTKYYKEFNPTIYVTENTYEKICVYCECVFKTVTSLRYYILDNYKEKQFIYETMTKTNEIITEDKINESYWNEMPRKLTKKDIEGIKYCVPADVNLSDADIDDISIETVEPEGDIEDLDKIFK